MNTDQIKQLSELIETIKALKQESKTLSPCSEQWLNKAIELLNKAMAYEDF
jgi:hypothetical protein